MTMHVTSWKTQRLKNSYIICIYRSTFHLSLQILFGTEFWNKSSNTNFTLCNKNVFWLDIRNSTGYMTRKWMLIWINKRRTKIKILRVAIINSGDRVFCYWHFTNLRTEKSKAYYLSVIFYWLCKNRKRASAKFFFFSLRQFFWRHLRFWLGQKRRSEKYTIQTYNIATQIKTTLGTLLSTQEYLRHFLTKNGYCYRIICFAFT